MLEFSRKEQYRARKDYTCHLCGKPIRKGREYVYEVQKYDGYLNELRRHIHCDALLQAFFEDTGYDEYSDDMVYEFLCDNICCRCKEREEADCDMWVYQCELVQKKMLKPTVFQAAAQSVRDNGEDEE